MSVGRFNSKIHNAHTRYHDTWVYHILGIPDSYYAALLRRRGPHIASHSVCLSVCPSVCPSVPFAEVVLLFLFLFTFFYSRTVLRANIQNRKTFVFAYGPASRNVLFGTDRGPHIVRPSRPHKLVLLLTIHILSGYDDD